MSALAYLLASVLFIFGLKRLASPATARSGNALAALGMLIAIVVTLLHREIASYTMIAAGLILGAVVGGLLARAIKMTAMPQMVALLNGFGGGASALVAAAEFVRLGGAGSITPDIGVSIQFSVLVGSLTFTGSLIAFGKLQELMTGRAVAYPFQKTLNALLLTALLVIGTFLVVWGAAPEGPLANGLGALFGGSVLLAFVLLVVLSALLGVLSVIPIGGADMPVVISLLNSYSGIAAASAGFVIGNHGLIISGALVGASGLILTNIMCKGMNRSLANVLFGAFGASPAAPSAVAAGPGGGSVRQVTAEDAAVLLAYARSVVFVPGYGLAVAQAQHQVRELADLLEERGVDVKYAIHPVAGRMPGHMNVLLAEASVPYDKLWEMERINSEFSRTSVAVVIGANDVVNPAARHSESSPIYGMPILDVDEADHIVVMKRSMNPGFAGIDNELFYHPKTSMLFGDAKASLSKLIVEVKAA